MIEISDSSMAESNEIRVKEVTTFSNVPKSKKQSPVKTSAEQSTRETRGSEQVREGKSHQTSQEGPSEDYPSEKFSDLHHMDPEMLNKMSEPVDPELLNEMSKLIDPEVFNGICKPVDPEFLNEISEPSSEEFIKKVRASVSLLIAGLLRLTEIASTAESFKSYAMALESKCQRLESILSIYEASCEKKENQFTSIVATRDKLALEYDRKLKEWEEKSKELEVAQEKIKNLEATTEELKQSSESKKGEIVELNKDIEWYKSEEFKNRMVDDFRGSDEYKNELCGKAYVFMNSGAAHIVRQIHHFFKDKTPLLQAYDGLYGERAYRGGSDFVPYTEEELRQISGFDRKKGEEPWQPPPPTNPTFFDMLKIFSPASGASLGSKDICSR